MKFFVVLISLMLVVPAVALDAPPRSIVSDDSISNNASSAVVLVTNSSRGFDYSPARTTYVEIFNSASADSVWVDLEDTTATETDIEIFAGETLALNFETTGLGIITAVGPDIIRASIKVTLRKD